MSGERWLRWSRAWFGDGTVETVIEPLVADWRHEAAASGSRRLRTSLRWQIAVARSFFACFAHHMRKPLPVGLGSGTWLRVEAFAALGALVLMAPFAKSAPPVGLGTLLPTTLCLSLPLAAVPALILASARQSIPSRAVRWLALRAAILLTAIMLPLAGWVMPAFNQNWRELNAPADYRRPVLRGARELTLSELFVPSVSPLVTEPMRKFQAHSRVAVILMPMSLCALGIAASRRVRRPLRGALAWWVIAAACWFLAGPLADITLQHRAGFPLVAWAPNLMVLALAGLPCRRPIHEADVRS